MTPLKALSVIGGSEANAKGKSKKAILSLMRSPQYAKLPDSVKMPLNKTRKKMSEITQ